jgi:DNA-binding transcriptional ArsR family regulator
MPKSDVHARSRGRRPLPEDTAQAIADRMHALSTPSRVRLLYALRHGERSAGELAALAQVTQAGASQQLRILRHLDLVLARRDGRTVKYRLHDEHVGALLDEIRNHAEHARPGMV